LAFLSFFSRTLLLTICLYLFFNNIDDGTVTATGYNKHHVIPNHQNNVPSSHAPIVFPEPIAKVYCGSHFALFKARDSNEIYATGRLKQVLAVEESFSPVTLKEKFFNNKTVNYKVKTGPRQILLYTPVHAFIAGVNGCYNLGLGHNSSLNGSFSQLPFKQAIKYASFGKTHTYFTTSKFCNIYNLNSWILMFLFTHKIDFVNKLLPTQYLDQRAVRLLALVEWPILTA